MNEMEQLLFLISEFFYDISGLSILLLAEICIMLLWGLKYDAFTPDEFLVWLTSPWCFLFFKSVIYVRIYIPFWLIVVTENVDSMADPMSYAMAVLKLGGVLGAEALTLALPLFTFYVIYYSKTDPDLVSLVGAAFLFSCFLWIFMVAHNEVLIFVSLDAMFFIIVFLNKLGLEKLSEEFLQMILNRLVGVFYFLLRWAIYGYIMIYCWVELKIWIMGEFMFVALMLEFAVMFISLMYYLTQKFYG